MFGIDVSSNSVFWGAFFGAFFGLWVSIPTFVLADALAKKLKRKKKVPPPRISDSTTPVDYDG